MPMSEYMKLVRKSNRHSKKVYTYLPIVENARTKNGPRQHLILDLGTANTPPLA